jgi:hypothetical protein
LARAEASLVYDFLRLLTDDRRWFAWPAPATYAPSIGVLACCIA